MQRRNFIKNLFVLLGTPGVAIAATHKTLDRQRHILIQQSPVAGFQYHEGEDVWPQLAVGDTLHLVREAANRYDRQAVRVEWRGHKLGYVPRRDNTAVSQMLDRGQRLRASITELNSETGPWGRLKMAIITE